jgi:hypothetical protein
MTATDATDAAPEVEQPTIPTTTVEVEDLGTVGEAQLDGLTKTWLGKVLHALDAPVPKGATRDDLEMMCRNGLRLRAMLQAGAPVEEQRAVDAPDQPGDTVNAGELEPTSGGVVPELSRWQMIQDLAAYLFKSNLRPLALKNEHDVGVVLLAANDLGIPLTQALQKIVVQNGRLSMMGELMSALILRDGHELRYDEANTTSFARVYGRRRDSETWHAAQFTIEEAAHAGLCSIEADGAVRARSKDGKKLPWELYTSDMLCWRALARLARRHFGDCLGGVSYTPDELGYIDTDSGDALPAARGGMADQPTMTVNAQRSELAARITQLPEDLRKDLAEEWKRKNLPRVDDLRPGAIRQVRKMIEVREAAAQERIDVEQGDVEDAVVVPDGEGAGDAPDGPETAVEETAAPEDPTDSPDGEDEPVEVCAGCGEVLGDGVHPVYDDEDRAWHQECSPFFKAPDEETGQ